MTDNNTTLLTLGEADSVMALALVFCILLLAIGFKEKPFWLLAGPVWIWSGVAIYNAYDPFFMIAGVGIGMVLFIWGAYSVLD